MARCLATKLHQCKITHAPCLFGNTGSVNKSIVSRNMPVDSRQLIDRKWYNDYIEPFMTFDQFCSNPTLYPTNQAGVISLDETSGSVAHYRSMAQTLAQACVNKKENNLDSTGTSSSMRDAPDRGFNSVRSFHSLMYAGSACDPITSVQKEIPRKQTNLTIVRNATENLAKLEKKIELLVSESDEMTPLMYLYLLYDSAQCTWCNMCVVPEIRATVNDMTHMARSVSALISALDNPSFREKCRGINAGLLY